MRRYTVSAKYARFIEATIAIAIAEAASDREHREDEDPRVRRMAKVPEKYIDAGAEGDVEILVDGVEAPHSVVVEASEEGRLILYGITPSCEVIPLPEPLKVAS